jgi:glucosamine kinase
MLIRVSSEPRDSNKPDLHESDLPESNRLGSNSSGLNRAVSNQAESSETESSQTESEFFVLGLDAGGSSLKLAISDQNAQVRFETHLKPFPGHILDMNARPVVLEHLRSALTQVQSFAPQAAFAGCTGLTTPDGLHDIRGFIAKQLQLPIHQVQTSSDIELAYRAHFEAGEGILVYAGTGSIAYHLRLDGAHERAGGHGFLIDDAGAGFSIGQAALRSVMREFDEGRSSSMLARFVFGHANTSTWPELSAFVYAGGRASVAGFAPLVGRAASQGDETARTILETAGKELLRLAKIMRSRLGDLPVALAGGALEISPMLAQTVRHEIPELLVTRGGFERAAANLALRLLVPR